MAQKPRHGRGGHVRKPKKQKRKAPPTNYPNQPRGPGQTEGPGGGGGGGGAGQPPPDWLGIPGLPPDVAAKIDTIFRSGVSQEEKQRQAITYLMTTPWFKENYKGYAEGFAKNMFADPFSGGLAQYKGYESQVQQSYRSFYGRAVTRDELASFITLGLTAGQVGQIGSGHAYVEANRAEIQQNTGAFGGGGLSEQELQAYGQEQQGYDTLLGQKIMARVQKSLATAQRVFQGSLGSSALGDQALSNTLQNRRKADISA